MKKNAPLLALLAAAGGLAYYYFVYRKGAAKPAGSGGSGSGGANFVPTAARPNATTTSSSTNPLVNQAIQTGSNLLSQLLNSLLGKGKGSSGGGGGGSISLPPSVGNRTASSGPLTTSTVFGRGITGSTTINASGDTLVQTNADFSNLFGDPYSGASVDLSGSGFGSNPDYAGEVSGGNDLSSVDLSSYDTGSSDLGASVDYGNELGSSADYGSSYYDFGSGVDWGSSSDFGNSSADFGNELSSSDVTYADGGSDYWDWGSTFGF